MWRKILNLVWKRQRKPIPDTNALPTIGLDDGLRQEALEHARLLFSKGVSVRHIVPGEVPEDLLEPAETIH